MRALVMLLAVMTVGGFATEARAGGSIRLAQTSTTTNCMLNCNSALANCQSSCVLPAATATATSNASASSSCLLACTNTQLTCQTLCARVSPSQ